MEKKEEREGPRCTKVFPEKKKKKKRTQRKKGKEKKKG